MNHSAAERPGDKGAATRRWRRRSSAHWIAAVSYFAILVLLNWRVLVAGGTLQAWLWEDFVEYFYPIRVLVTELIRQGILPLWDPYIFAGGPLLADPGAGVLYPPNLLLALLPMDGKLPFRALEWQAFLHVWLAGLGTYLLAARWGRTFWGPFVGGLVFMLSGFMTMHIIHLSVIQAACWLPYVLRCSAESYERGSMRLAVGAGGLLALSFLAGHAQTTALVALGPCAAAAAALMRRPSREQASASFRRFPAPIALLGVSLATAAGLTAPQWMPSMEFLSLSDRQPMSYEKASEGSLGPIQFITFVAPDFLGTVSSVDRSSYRGPGPYYHYWELAGYTGVLPLSVAVTTLVLAVKARVHRRKVLLAGTLGFFSLLLALGRNGPVHPVLFDLSETYRRFRVPGRALLVFDFCVALLAGMGVAVLISAPPRVRRVVARVAAASVALLASAALTAGLLLLGPSAQSGTGASPGFPEAALSLKHLLLVAAVSLGALWLNGSARMPAAFRGALFVAVVVWDLSNAGRGFAASPRSPVEFFEGDRPQLVRKLQQESKAELFRIQTRPLEAPGLMVLPRNQGPILGIQSVEGYNPIRLAVTSALTLHPSLRFDLLNVKYTAALESGRPVLRRNDGYCPRFFFVNKSSTARNEAEALALLSRGDFDPRHEVVLMKSGPGDAPDRSDARQMGSATIQVSRYEPDLIDVSINAPSDGYLVLSEVYYPGWKARVDGTEVPVLRADYCLRAVRVRAGTCRVELGMEAPAFRRGVAWAAVTVTAIFVWVVARRRRSPGPGDSDAVRSRQ